MRKQLFWLLLGAFVLALFVLDQVTKEIVVANILPGEQIAFVGPLQLTLLYNPHFAFGIEFVSQSLIIPIMIFALAGFFLLLFYLPRNTWVLLVGALIFSGGLSNLFDRLSRGEVVDYLLIPHWPAFNLADASVTVGFVLFVIYLLFFSPREVFRQR